jgi:hypothetical protein
MLPFDCPAKGDVQKFIPFDSDSNSSDRKFFWSTTFWYVPVEAGYVHSWTVAMKAFVWQIH